MGNFSMGPLSRRQFLAASSLAATWGAADPADVALIGSRSEVLDRLDGVRAAAASEFLVFGDEGEQVETVSCLQEYVRR